MARLWKIDCERAFPEGTDVSRALVYSCVILGGLVVNPGRLYPQTLMRGTVFGGTVQLIGSDSAVLDADEPKKDLPCTVTPVKPLLGFDLRFHSGYEIAVPLHEISAMAICSRSFSASHRLPRKILPITSRRSTRSPNWMRTRRETLISAAVSTSARAIITSTG